MTPPSKKQAPRAEQQHAEEQPAPITRLLACDDLLGKVYSSCEDAATRHALRVSCSACYRSPATNSLIDTFNIKSHMTPENSTSALAAFPRLARMKKLTIDWSDTETLFMHLLGPSPEASAARANLQSVDTITFNACQLNALSATALHILFPIMRSDHGRIQLTGQCSVSSGVFGMLAAQTHVTELEMIWCSPSPLHELASFRSLRSLTLVGIKSFGLLSLEPLCAGTPSAGPLLQLSKLDLTCLDNVTGLDVCLANHPIRELTMKGVYFPASLASSMRLVSTTLRVMRMWLNLSFPDISVANFPSLHLIETVGLDLRQIPGMNAEEGVQRCNRLASGIAGFPCVQCIDEAMSSKGMLFRLNGHEWSSAQLLELLQGLAPLRPALQSIRGARICNANVGVGAMRVIASLFPNLESLELWQEYGHEYSDVEEGLVAAVSNMSRLKYIFLDVTESFPPRDIFAALTLASARQNFHLDLVPDNHECKEKLECVSQNWEKMKLLFPYQCKAKFTVDDPDLLEE